MNQLGVWGLPGTFPTEQVELAIVDFIDPPFYDRDKYFMGRDKINTIYFTYKDAILNHDFNKYGDEKSTELVEYIIKETGYEIKDVRTVLLFIKNMAETGDIDNKFYTIETPPSGAAAIVSTPFKFLDRQAKNIKWIAIAGMAGVGLYFTWPLLVKGRKKLKGRK